MLAASSAALNVAVNSFRMAFPFDDRMRYRVISMVIAGFHPGIAILFQRLDGEEQPS
jgi:hypothetical protein